MVRAGCCGENAFLCPWNCAGAVRQRCHQTQEGPFFPQHVGSASARPTPFRPPSLGLDFAPVLFLFRPRVARIPCVEFSHVPRALIPEQRLRSNMDRRTFGTKSAGSRRISVLWDEDRRSCLKSAASRKMPAEHFELEVQRSKFAGLFICFDIEGSQLDGTLLLVLQGQKLLGAAAIEQLLTINPCRLKTTVTRAQSTGQRIWAYRRHWKQIYGGRERLISQLFGGNRAAEPQIWRLIWRTGGLLKANQATCSTHTPTRQIT